MTKKSQLILEENLTKYNRVSEQGCAVWVPKEIKKRLEMLRAKSDRQLSIRQLASAFIMSYLDEHGQAVDELL